MRIRGGLKEVLWFSDVIVSKSTAARQGNGFDATDKEQTAGQGWSGRSLQGDLGCPEILVVVIKIKIFGFTRLYQA